MLSLLPPPKRRPHFFAAEIETTGYLCLHCNCFHCQGEDLYLVHWAFLSLSGIQTWTRKRAFLVYLEDGAFVWLPWSFYVELAERELERGKE